MRGSAMFTPFLKILPLILLQSLLLISFSGCDSSPENSDDKLEHLVPLHKPHGFPELVRTLRKRISELSGTPSQEDLEQLTDIVHWIPEIAAETDLRQKEWDVADSVSRKLSSRFQEVRNSGNFNAAAIHELQELAELLQPLADLCRDDKI